MNLTTPNFTSILNAQLMNFLFVVFVESGRYLTRYFKLKFVKTHNMLKDELESEIHAS
jgi:hypothetical protein